MAERTYKDHRVYACIALNRLVQELGINLYQDDLEGKLDRIMSSTEGYVSKEVIKHEIRSNHHMTNKVLRKLAEDGLVEIRFVNNKYKIRATKKGVLYARKYNLFYFEMYREHLLEHYKYTGLPSWLRGLNVD